MFVRTKRSKGRRYLYLVEGKREGGIVRQKTLCYLGPLSTLTAGVPDALKENVDARLRVDWKKIDKEIQQIPLSFEELSEARIDQFAISARMKRQGRPSQGDLPRPEGELSALTKLAVIRFKELFQEVEPLVYRMR